MWSTLISTWDKVLKMTLGQNKGFSEVAVVQQELWIWMCCNWLVYASSMRQARRHHSLSLSRDETGSAAVCHLLGSYYRFITDCKWENITVDTDHKQQRHLIIRVVTWCLSRECTMLTNSSYTQLLTYWHNYYTLRQNDSCQQPHSHP